MEQLRLSLGACQLEVDKERKRSEDLLRVLASEEWAREAVASLFYTGTSAAPEDPAVVLQVRPNINA